MNIIRRGTPAAEPGNKKSFTEPAMNRRIEVTVERETVTVLVRGQPNQSAGLMPESAAEIAAEITGTEARLLEPPAAKKD